MLAEDLGLMLKIYVASRLARIRASGSSSLSRCLGALHRRED